MSDFWRAFSMLLVWAATSVISITIITNEGVFSQGNAWIIIPVLFAAAVATAFVWDSPKNESRSKSKSLEKAKRSTDPDAKMRLLLEMMDEDERYAFKQAMKERMLSGSRDGELNYDADSLSALLDEDQPKRYKR